MMFFPCVRMARAYPCVYPSRMSAYTLRMAQIHESKHAHYSKMFEILAPGQPQDPGPSEPLTTSTPGQPQDPGRPGFPDAYGVMRNPCATHAQTMRNNA